MVQKLSQGGCYGNVSRRYGSKHYPNSNLSGITMSQRDVWKVDAEMQFAFLILMAVYCALREVRLLIRTGRHRKQCPFKQTDNVFAKVARVRVPSPFPPCITCPIAPQDKGYHWRAKFYVGITFCANEKTVHWKAVWFVQWSACTRTLTRCVRCSSFWSS